MPAFNLVTDPWIPVRWIDPSRREPLVSLRTLFTEAERIADLSANPAERVSLMRLLVCATQAALGAPPHPKAWRGFGGDLATAVPEYLDRPEIHERFELFGDGARFLQVPIQSKGDPVPASKLLPHLASGNNPTLFDHEGGTTRATSSPRLALGLLVFQCFYPLYGAGYKGKGPCVDQNMLHLLLRGENLAETILRNCLDAETIAAQFPSGIGKPIWEGLENDGAFSTNATETYLGRLVPRHRNLRLADDGTGFHLSKEAMAYPAFEAAIEPTATVTLRKKGAETVRALLPARLQRAAWRDLHLMCAMRVAEGEAQGAAPLVLQSHVSEILAADLPQALVWTGALVTDLKAKILDTVESLHTVPARMLASFDAQQDYRSGVEYAETMRGRLYGAVKTYFSAMRHESAWETKPIPDDFFDRESFRFSLLANPTRKVRSNGKGELLKNSRRVPVFYDPEKKADPATRIDARAALVEWLDRQACAHGFRFEEKTLKTVPRPRQVFVKKSRADETRHAGLHAAVEFVGELAVTDPAAFRRAVASGIGPAKAFGFGLLCLAPR